MNFKNTVIITNAPPGAGKDTVCDALAERLGMTHNRFKTHLYRLTAAVFNVSESSFIGWATDRTFKELPMMEMNGNSISPREAMIYVSEQMIKPHFGKDYFGKIFAENLDIVNGTVASDGGFESEVYPVIEKVGIENVFIVQFTGQGKNSFDGDSRDWLNIPGVATLKTTNDGTIDEMVQKIYQFLLSHKENKA